MARTNISNQIAKRRAPRTAFKKGHAPIPGSGRPKGSKNRFTREVKEALLNAFNAVGGEAWLAQLARKDRRSFAALLGKLIPTQLTGKDDGPISVQVQQIQIGLTRLSDKELETLDALLTKAGLHDIANSLAEGATS